MPLDDLQGTVVRAAMLGRGATGAGGESERHSVDALVARVVELQKRHQERTAHEKRNKLTGAPLPHDVVQLPLWPDLVRGVPNGFLRSALFGAIAKGRRRYMSGERVTTLDGLTILYTGERLDQGDLDGWESVLHVVRLQALGVPCRVTSYSLLKLMGKTDTGKNRRLLHTRITRLRANAVEIRQDGWSYIGGLIDEAYKDHETQEWVIVVSPKLHSPMGMLASPVPLIPARYVNIDQLTTERNTRASGLKSGYLVVSWLPAYVLGICSCHSKPHPAAHVGPRRLSSYSSINVSS
ncbi:hypothetical protein HDG34_004999 [Paraburkholderia sp. HC6.4b]|uniref:plasmid replication initiator TrfA n=1 Tax=unclassified Paraburkholderia TaxID=2615204 RepID=UPI001804AE1D|nr:MULTISPECIES: plasmid replication initiator TrfA [unclassified Paraburkholderia]MBB5411042.1 hypothetical protein [Paraburkholderia sp. HC6.4b]MBB5455158.1 hypothetical protein [Paraburkholderia sp. Kb1A]